MEAFGIRDRIHTTLQNDIKQNLLTDQHDLQAKLPAYLRLEIAQIIVNYWSLGNVMVIFAWLFSASMNNKD